MAGGSAAAGLAAVASPKPSATSSATSSAAPAAAPWRRPQVYRGADLRYSMEITLEQAAHGHEAQIRMPHWDDCEHCHGSGAKPGSSVETCPTCNGVGQVRMSQGFFTMQQTCPKCHGSGKFIPKPCTKCHGQGKLKRRRRSRSRFRRYRRRDAYPFVGNGEPGINGGPPGDLYVEVHIKQHPVFERDGDDLHCQMPISFATAALGGDIEVPTLGGRPVSGAGRHPGRQDVPPARQGHQGCALRISGRPLRACERGDAGQADRGPEGHAASVRPLGARGRFACSPQEQSWLDKVKSFFS
jgi:molecular chaperone DnaJ